MTDKTENTKPYIAYSQTTTRGLLRGFKLINEEKGIVAADIALMSGKERDGQQRYLNGSFIVSKPADYFAKQQINVDYGAGVKVKVTINDLYCEPKADAKDPDTLYANYRGFLKEITIGS